MSLQPRPKRIDKAKPADPQDSVFGLPSVVLLSEKQWSYIQRRYRMSPRELQVAKLVCRGLTNGDVAERLSVKSGTVKTHLRSIFAKARARNKITLLLRLVDAVAGISGEPGIISSATSTRVDKQAGGSLFGTAPSSQ